MVNAVDEAGSRTSTGRREDGGGRADVVQPLEDRQLELGVLRDRFDYQLGARRALQAGREAHPPEGGFDLGLIQQPVPLEEIQALADALQGGVEARPAAADQHHLFAGGGENLRDAVAHDPVADHSHHFARSS